MTKSKAVETNKGPTQAVSARFQREIAWHLVALAKTDHEEVESLVLIFANALYDEGAEGDAEDREVRWKWR